MYIFFDAPHPKFGLLDRNGGRSGWIDANDTSLAHMPAELLPPGEAGQPGTLGLQIFLPEGPEEFEVRSNRKQNRLLHPACPKKYIHPGRHVCLSRISGKELHDDHLPESDFYPARGGCSYFCPDAVFSESSLVPCASGRPDLA